VQAASKGMWDESKIFGAPDFNKEAMKPQRMGSGRLEDDSSLFILFDI
jgi:hypothetical protein